MNVGIKMTLELLARSAWLSRFDPRVQLLARDVTDVETGRADKMRALVDELHRRFVLAPDPPTQERSVMDLFDINKLDEQMRREIDSVVNPRPSIDADDACVFVAAAAMMLAWRRRSSPGGLWLLLILLAAAWWRRRNPPARQNRAPAPAAPRRWVRHSLWAGS